MLPHRWLLLLLLAASVAAAGETNMSLGSSSARPRHNLAHLWPWQSVVGLVGVVLNSAVFYAFIRERQNMARPVNVLVWWVTRKEGGRGGWERGAACARALQTTMFWIHVGCEGLSTR